MILLKLFWDFFKVSCFTFGGAYGAIPLIRDMVMQNGWLTDERLSYMIAISESTPGPIMVNMATYIGNDQAGFWGSLIATCAVVLPAYLVIMLVMGILKHTIQKPGVQAVLRGLKPCVIGIVLDPDDIHIMHKSRYSGMFGDYSSYSEEFDEMNDPTIDLVEEELDAVAEAD